MYLYHGSDVEVAAINFDKCRAIADFGKGFYTTSNWDQAVKWAKRKAIEHMGSGIILASEVLLPFLILILPFLTILK